MIRFNLFKDYTIYSTRYRRYFPGTCHGLQHPYTTRASDSQDIKRLCYSKADYGNKKVGNKYLNTDEGEAASISASPLLV